MNWNHIHQRYPWAAGIFTLVSLGAAIAHILRPEWAIDEVFLALLVLATIPWIFPMIRTFEGFGVKFSLNELQSASDPIVDQIRRSTAERHHGDNVPRESIFEWLNVTDGQLLLAAVRIEMEKRLRQLAVNTNSVSEEHAQRLGVGQLTRRLSQEGVLDRLIAQQLREVAIILNQAVHGAEVEGNTAEWAIDSGSEIIAFLDGQLEAVQRGQVWHPTSGTGGAANPSDLIYGQPGGPTTAGAADPYDPRNRKEQ